MRKPALDDLFAVRCDGDVADQDDEENHDHQVSIANYYNSRHQTMCDMIDGKLSGLNQAKASGGDGIPLPVASPALGDAAKVAAAGSGANVLTVDHIISFAVNPKHPQLS